MEGIGVGLIIVLVVLAVAELALVIWALVDIARRPRTSALPRWGWVLLVIFFNLIGPVAYLLVGRRDETVVDEWSARQAGAASPPEQGVAGSAGPAPGQTAAAPGAAASRTEAAGGSAAAGTTTTAVTAVGGSPSEDLPDEASEVPEAPAAPEPPAAEPSRTERAIDTLYGTEASEE